MPAKRINANKNTLFAAAPYASVADCLKPTLAEVNASTNYSDAVKWDNYNFGLQASEQDQDRALTDAAGAATRGYENFGGAVSLFMPTPADTSSVVRQARTAVSVPHTELVIYQRDGYLASAAWAVGQVFNAYHVITDANAHERGTKNRFYTIAFQPKGYVGVNRIVPSASATAVAITGGSTVASGASIQLRATYEGNDITVGAVWVSSDETKAVVTKHGIVIGISAGSVSITATYPGSAAGSPKAITVS